MFEHIHTKHFSLSHYTLVIHIHVYRHMIHQRIQHIYPHKYLFICINYSLGLFYILSLKDTFKEI